jgi:carboxyvinyl-carboxyphosphonate phosphorylmutase
MNATRPPLTAHAKRLVLRTLLQGDSCVRPASTFDPLSALAAQEIGYPMGILAGSVASLSVLGAPDITLITLSELVEQARRVCRVSDLPLLVDGDHGYGNALNVRRMVADMEAAGVAAVSVEDTLLPAPFGAGDKGQLIPIREIAAKLRAALEARSDPAFVVMGRTHATLVASREDLLARQAALQEAGVDAVFVTGLRDPADLDALAARATVPLVLGTMVKGMDGAALAARKVRVCLQGHEAFYQGIKAVYANLAQLHTGASSPDVNAQELARRLARTELHAQWGRDYLQ